MQTEQHLCWSGMTDTVHGSTFGSNEVGLVVVIQFCQQMSPFSGIHYSNKKLVQAQWRI